MNVLGRQADLKDKDAREVIERVAGAAAKWESFAKDYDVSNESRQQIAKALKSTRLE